MLADVFENFLDIYLELYKFDPAHFLTAPRLAWQLALKKTKLKLDLLTDTDILYILLMVEKDIKVKYVMLFNDMQKLIINTWRTMIKIKNGHILSIAM